MIKISNYIYKDPVKEGYTKFSLTRQQHNIIFAKHKLKWCDRYEYYMNDTNILLHKFTNIQGIIAMTLLFPIMVFVDGFESVIRDIKRLYCPKKYGDYISFIVYEGTEAYAKVLAVLRRCK